MRIFNLRVQDPRVHGNYQDPVLFVGVDEYVDEIGEPIYNYKKELQYRVIPCGPFFAAEYRPDNGVTYDEWVDVTEHDQADFGVVNKIGLIPDQLFPVWVVEPEGHGVLPLAMPVPRLRRLLRKSTGRGFSGWHLEVDDDAALKGLLKWRLECNEPMCYGGSKPGQANCRLKPSRTVLYRGTHLPLCPEHLLAHENRIRRARLINSTR